MVGRSRGLQEAVETAHQAAEKVAPRATSLPRGLLARKAATLFAEADVAIDGARPWDIQVHDPRLYRRAFAQGALGFGEAYMDGWWDAEDLAGLFERILARGFEERFGRTLPVVRDRLVNTLVNLQRGQRAFRVGEHHYDIGNDLYRMMLDRRMIYSCAYWKGAHDLDAAQERKLDLICRKLHLEPGMRILDIGCGWGGLLRYAAEEHGVEGVGVTVSKEQAALAEDNCAGLPIEIRLQDYRHVESSAFDRVVSVGMFEHVGHKNYRTYMETVHRLLKPGGLQLLHTIGRPCTVHVVDPWVSKYIFPNGMLPSLAEITKAADGLFPVEDLQNIGPHYDPTLVAWFTRFDREWEVIRQSDRGYDERFYRMWTYYLLSAAAAFRVGNLQVWQIVMAKDRGVRGGYEAAR